MTGKFIKLWGMGDTILYMLFARKKCPALTRVSLQGKVNKLI